MVKGITSMTKNTKFADFAFEIGTLRKLARAHRQTLLTDDLSDNIASHSFRVATIGWLLAQKEKADPYKVTTMCLFHDVPETRSGDQNWVHKKYVKVFEDEIIKDQIKDLPGSNELGKIINEYQERKTIEAKIAKDADLIDQILLLKEYDWQGNKEATVWLKGHQQYDRISTKSAKSLAKEIIKQKPHSWWNNIWTSNRR